MPSKPGFTLPPIIQFMGDQQRPQHQQQQHQQQNQQQHQQQQQHPYPNQSQQHLSRSFQYPDQTSRLPVSTPPLYSPHHHASGSSQSHTSVMTPPLFITTPGMLSPPAHPHTPTERVHSPSSPGRGRKHEPSLSTGAISISSASSVVMTTQRPYDSNDSYFTHHPHGRSQHANPLHFEQEL
ncbi:hypothetical protein BX616_010373, partial [Lobosporangium transversale]